MSLHASSHISISTSVQTLQEIFGIYVTFLFLCSLVEKYEDICGSCKVEIIPGFVEMFPKQFNVGHVVEIWKYTVVYHMKQQRK